LGEAVNEKLPLPGNKPGTFLLEIQWLTPRLKALSLRTKYTFYLGSEILISFDNLLKAFPS
jgi:hypothetical protein